MLWLWITLGVLLAVPPLALLVFHIYVLFRYMDVVTRIFQEKPLFIIPHGQPVPDAEQVTVTTADGLALQGCYLKTTQPVRKGVILFGIEFDSKCWSCRPYTEFLREAGYDIFACEMRGQGTSPAQPGYQPLQWMTEYELLDLRAAVAYLKQRPDADPQGIGFFGISKGGSAGLYIACEDPFLRCCVTDGIFATHVVMVPYMQKWIFIYTRLPWLPRLLPRWYYRYVASLALRKIEKIRHCSYPHLEAVIKKLAPRPWLMIHGGGDTYIKPEMAEDLFRRARGPKELWIVDKAKHNQALQIANGEYKRRIQAFFDQHLARPLAPPAPNGSPQAPDAATSVVSNAK